jgi:hypothetical protein
VQLIHLIVNNNYSSTITNERPAITYDVDETPYYRPPVNTFVSSQEIQNTEVVKEKKSTTKIGMLALAGVIGVLTIGSVILGDD